LILLEERERERKRKKEQEKESGRHEDVKRSRRFAVVEP